MKIFYLKITIYFSYIISVIVSFFILKNEKNVSKTQEK